MKNIKKITALCASLALIFCGCTEKSENRDNLSDSKPWNEYILETDEGYYINGELMYLVYIDKNTGKEVELCSKPECPHDGRKTCVATYNSLWCSNSVMYNGAIYFAGTEMNDDKREVNLYRVSPDGSALDKIASVDSMKDRSPEADQIKFETFPFDYPALQIYDGNAYISYSLYTGMGGFAGFGSGGLVRISLADGKVSDIVKYDDYFSPKVADYFVCGESIVLNIRENSKNIWKIKSLGNNTETILDSKITVATTDCKNIVCIRTPEPGETGKFIYEMNPETGEKSDYEINTTDYTPGRILSYNGRLYIAHMGKSEVSVYENGNEVCIFDSKPDDYDESLGAFAAEYAVSYNKFYVLTGDAYSCSLDDIMSGKTEWKKTIDVSEFSQKYNSRFDEIMKNSMTVSGEY